jgi:prephenate dehydrogenase
MTKPVITIIGLGLTGASMGLGLQREVGNFEIVGHDKQPEVAQEARKIGAVQRVEWNLYRACEGAELIVVATPLVELESLLPLLAEEMKPGTLVFAIGSLLQPVIAIGSKCLPEGVHFVAGHAIVTAAGSTANARADLFEKAVFALAAGVKTDPNAIQLASDFVERMGATPLFVDAQEHDGVIAGVEQLPVLLAAALMRFSAKGAGWREARRLAGRHFASATDTGSDAAALYSTLQANRESVLLKLRSLQQELAEWQEMLEGDGAVAPAATPTQVTTGAGNSNAKRTEKGESAPMTPLLAALTEAVAARQTWEAQALLKNWEESVATPTSVESGGFLRQMFLGGLGNRQRNRK